MSQMNAEVLLDHFNRISEVPDAVPRLRQFILDLAVRGKLVKQDERDEPANELAARIQRNLISLVKQGKIKKKKPLPDIQEDEIPFAIPNSWQWTRLSNITSYIQRGKSPKYSSGDGLPVISQKCVQWAGLDMDVAKKITTESIQSYEPIRFLLDGDLLWNSTGTGTIGRVLLISNPPSNLVCDSHVTVVRCLEVDQEYIRTWLRSDHVYGIIESRAAGSTNQIELTAQLANMQVVPLPPLPEQKRIVAKVDELMVLCDRLESQQVKREDRRDRLAKASLHRVNQPPQPTAQEDSGVAAEYQEHVSFHLTHLPKLLTKPEHVKELRQSILNLAVRGRLVPQDPTDEPAFELLEKVRKQRNHLIAQKGIKSQKKGLKNEAFESRALIPQSWEAVYFEDLAYQITDGTHQTPKYVTLGCPFLSAQNIKPFSFMPEDHRFVSEEDFKKYRENRKPEKGDILLTRVGAGIGEAAVITSELEFAFYVSLCLIKVPSSCVLPEYIVIWLNSPEGRLYSSTRTYGKGASQGNLNLGLIRTFKIPLPPLAEQHRIVAKVGSLMSLCDQLEYELTRSHNRSRRLLEAVLREALGNGKPIPTQTVMASAPKAGPATSAKIANIPKEFKTSPSPAPTSQNSAEAILAHMRPGQTYTRAQIIDALNLSVGVWNSAIRELKERGLVVQAGQKRGARYSLAS